MKTILIVDDDIHIGNMLEEVLHREAYVTLRAYSGTEALLLLENTSPDLILLDLMLPGLSGEDILPKLKDIPTIVVSAKADTVSKVELLLGGAVDYITKPFDIKELLARMQVALRSNTAVSSAILFVDKLKLDTVSHRVLADGKEVKLTRTEYAILKMLMRNPDQVISKSQLLDHIAEDTPDCTESSLKIHVSNLRKKLREKTGKDHIEAVWGIGFKLNAE